MVVKFAVEVIRVVEMKKGNILKLHHDTCLKYKAYLEGKDYGRL
jgi:hypothetical protein